MPAPFIPAQPRRLEMPDTAFLFEPHSHKPLPNGDESLPRSLFMCCGPSSSLADSVDIFWFYRCDRSVRVRERVLPTGTMGLVIDLRDDAPAPSVYGAYSESYAVDPAGEAWLVGVNFKPGGAYPFLNSPAGDLQNAHVSLDTFWGSDADVLRAQLLEAKNPATMFRILEHALLAQAVRTLVRHPAVAFALREFQARPNAPTVKNVTERIGLTPKRFIQLFTDQVGLTPKLFSRIRRFQDVLCLVRNGSPLKWTDVALNCGYYDQAHFIHDFRAFSGLTPPVYLQAWGEHLDYGARWTR
jgi:AraC-like DNA-binding protein